MTIYNLSEYNQNYSMTSGSLLNYFRDETDDVNYKSFNYKTKIVETIPERPARPPQPPQNPDGTQLSQPLQPALPTLNVEVIILLKHHSNFWRFLDLPLINCKIEFGLSWTNECVLIEHYNSITGTTFQINNAKLYIPVLLCC